MKFIDFLKVGALVTIMLSCAMIGVAGLIAIVFGILHFDFRGIVLGVTGAPIGFAISAWSCCRLFAMD